MNKKSITVMISLLIILLSVAGFYVYHTHTPKTIKITVKHYEVTEPIDDDTDENTDLQTELIDSEEKEMAVSDIEKIIGQEVDQGDSRKNSLVDYKANVKDAATVKKEEESLGLNGSIPYYYYKSLNSNEKNIYRTILSGYKDLSAKITVVATYSDFRKFHLMVLYDHPELFWIENNYSYWDYDSYVVVLPTYNRDKKEIETDQKKINDVVKKILKDAPTKKSAYNKTKYVFKYLCDHTVYVSGSPDNQNIYSCLVNKKTVCSGYTKATQYLLQKMGLTCIYLRGVSQKGGSHAWNIVKCGKKYYHVDTTWGDAYDNANKDVPSVLKYDYSHLCMNDHSAFLERTADYDVDIPTCDSEKLQYYKHNHRYYTSYGDKVRSSIRKNLKKGKHYWQGQFSNSKSYKAMLKDLNNGGYASLIRDVTGKKGTISTSWYNDDLKYIIKIYY